MSAPATFVTVGLGPTEVFVHDRFTGALRRRIPIQGTDLSREHPASDVAVDGFGRVYVSDNPQGILRLVPGGGQQQYATPFPDLPTCASVPAGTPCSPTAVDRPPLANGLAFDAFTRTALVVNHAPQTGDPDHFGVLRFCVRDPGWPLERPFIP